VVNTLTQLTNSWFI